MREVSTFRRILVPLDGSSFAEAALPAALALARRSGTQVKLVTAYEAPEFPGAPRDDRLRRWSEEYLTEIMRGWWTLGASMCTTVREGPPAREILAEADAWGAQMIVMASHGRGAVSRAWLGSVTDACVRHASVPILIVRPRPSLARSGAERFAPERVLLPLDGSELAERALAPAVAVAQTFGASIDLFRVAMEGAEAGAHAYLAGVARRLRDRAIPATVRVHTGERPAAAILEQAADDLVVIATHARDPVRRAFLGSVTDKVVRGGRGPVLVVPMRSGAADAVRHAPDCVGSPREPTPAPHG